MVKAIYVNLVVTDLTRSIEFFEKIGFKCNQQFTNEEAAALVLSGSIFAMLHTPGSIKRFTKKTIANPKNTTEVLVALQLNSREEVDLIMEKVIDAGGKEQREPEDHGFMYGRTFEDPDYHIWEVFWMNPEEFQG
ncbi:MAG: VOC family protein [Desulfocapsaceae bacterium]|nr:VOC family protein [Desulfocapsaceae bacterium]